MKKTVLRSYARLIARVGVNIQKGQEVMINCDLDQPKFVELLVDECYKAGARKVIVECRSSMCATAASPRWQRWKSGKRSVCSTMWTPSPAAST